MDCLNSSDWSYLVKSLRFVEGPAAQEVLTKLLTVRQRPQEAKYYRDVIIAGLKLKSRGGATAVRLIEFWSGEELLDSPKNWKQGLVCGH